MPPTPKPSAAVTVSTVEEAVVVVVVDDSEDSEYVSSNEYIGKIYSVD